MKNKFEKLTIINQKMYDACGSLKLLGHISWPAESEAVFLKNYEKGQIVLPEIRYNKVDYKDLKLFFENLRSQFTAEHPLELFTQKTLDSYLDTIELTSAIGTRDFTELSKKIFGKPGDLLPGSKANNVEAAQRVIDLANEFVSPIEASESYCISAEEIKAYIERRSIGMFKELAPKVEIVEGLAAKATASSRKIKLRKGTCFGQYDFKQLFYHEVMTHSLTSLNGETQPILKCMGRGSLRSLKTQEGLATFSEVITGSLDIHRLKRLALRIIAIDMGLRGASFVDIFRYFLENGQSSSESFSSTQRIFRGGYPDKNIIFTKDAVYLDGLINVHTLFRWAMKNNRLNLSHLLFCGRLSLDDLLSLESSYAQGYISAPKFLPGWYAKIDGLAGSLAFSLLANLVRIDWSDEKFAQVG